MQAGTVASPHCAVAPRGRPLRPMPRLAPALALIATSSVIVTLGASGASAQVEDPIVPPRPAEAPSPAEEESLVPQEVADGGTGAPGSEAHAVTGDTDVDEESADGVELPLPSYEPDRDPLGRLTPPGAARNQTESERSVKGTLWIPRLVFAPLRFVIWLVTQPLVELARLNDEHHFVKRFFQFFVSDEGTYGVVPNFFLETGFGLNAGLRLFHHDLFGHGEKIRARAGFGGFYSQHYQLMMASGNASSLFEVHGGLRWEARRNDRFYGIGNADRVATEDASVPHSPYDRDVAVRSRYRRKTLLAELGLAVQLDERMRLRLSHRWAWSRFDTGEPRERRLWIDEAYETNRLVAFSTPQTHAVTELRFILDRRRSDHYSTPRSLASSGAFFQAWASWQEGIRADPSKLARFGFDLDGYINLYNHDRVLKVRTRFEAVAGAKEHIPFDSWVRLSGPNDLRGYPRQRFHARYAGVGSLQYRYSIAANMSAFVFCDLGIIANVPEQARPESWRVGYGGGLMFYTTSTFIFAFQVAASEEGVFVNLSFAPASAGAGVPGRLSP